MKDIDFSISPTHESKRLVGDKVWIVREVCSFTWVRREPKYKTLIELGEIIDKHWNGQRYNYTFASNSFCVSAPEKSGDGFYYVNDFPSKAEARNQAYITYRGYGFNEKKE